LEFTEIIRSGNYHVAFFGKIFELFGYKIIASLYLLCKIKFQILILVDLVAIGGLDYTQGPHFNLIRRFTWQSLTHPKLALSRDVARALHLEAPGLKVDRLLLLLIGLLVKFLKFTRIFINRNIVEIKDSPLAIFFVLGVNDYVDELIHIFCYWNCKWHVLGIFGNCRAVVAIYFGGIGLAQGTYLIFRPFTASV